MAKKSEVSLSELSDLFKVGLNRAVSRPSIFGYVPHEKQISFHSAPERGRLYIGGNRSGKTVGGIVEDIWCLRGEHPYRKVPPAPIRGRIVTVSYTEGVKMIILPELAKWIPPSDLINGSWEDSYAKQERVLTLANGSTCEIMSYDQQLEKFAGTSRHFIHFDEEPPKPLFDECKMRLLDTAGNWWITMTPVEGMTWVYDDIYQPGLTPGSNIRVVSIDTTENPYISNAEVETALEGLDSNERQARKEGKFVHIGGLVFKEFNPTKNIVPPLDVTTLQKMSGWTHYGSMDHGYNNPTCWLWHAVSPTGLVITYDEIYDNERLVEYYARSIIARNQLPGRQAPNVYVGDPAIAQRNGQTGDSIQVAYSREGVPIVLGNNDVRIGINKMNQYLSNGKWIITENCPNLIRELQRVKWKIYDSAKKRFDNNVREEVHKKDDHAPDSARYFFSLMPDLYIPPGGKPDRLDGVTKNQIIQSAISATTVPVGPLYYDPNLRNLGKPRDKEYYYIDEHMGGL